MIIGGGMIASFLSSLASHEAVFWCAGVSCSAETRAGEFHRDLQRLRQASRIDVYVSSICAASRTTSYCRHKCTAEEIARSKGARILRLPNVIPDIPTTGNPSNMLRYFAEAAAAGQRIQALDKSTRFFTDSSCILAGAQAALRSDVTLTGHTVALSVPFVAKLVAAVFGQPDLVDTVGGGEPSTVEGAEGVAYYSNADAVGAIFRYARDCAAKTRHGLPQ